MKIEIECIRSYYHLVVDTLVYMAPAGIDFQKQPTLLHFLHFSPDYE
jgi:hypothetical protein